MKKILNELPARSLTSREISKIVAGVMTGFVDWCGAQPVCDALDHFVEFAANYKQAFRVRVFQRSEPPLAGEKTMKKILNELPARSLTSREISKIVAGVMTGFVDWCGAQPVCDALDHFLETAIKRNKI